jgi:soluble lytic murein transglycosylase-like protein
MTTKLLFASRRAGLLGWHPRPRQAPSRIVPLFAAAAVIFLSASTARLDASAAGSPGPTSLAAPPAEGGESTLAPARAAAVPPGNVDALVAMLARKYRVSQDATRELVDAAYREGGRNGVDPLLIIAVIGVESRFNPIAQSDGGAMGLMQVIPRYHEDKFDAANGESVLDPRTNIYVGARVLKEYIRRGGTETVGLQLYNGAIDDESNAYARKVLGEKQLLQSAIRRGT